MDKTDELGFALAIAAHEPAWYSHLCARERGARDARPFVDLEPFLDSRELDALDASLRAAVDDGGAAPDGGGASADGPAVWTEFRANCRKHADAIELQTRSRWPAHFEFEHCRRHRGNPHYWRPNANHADARFAALRGFVARLPFFEYTGKVTVIVNAPGDEGAEHVDHKMADWVSEFVWLRTSARKRFYVRDREGARHFVRSRCVWFDDHLAHNIARVDDAPATFSIRVDGKFNARFRSILACRGCFAQPGLREVLLAQCANTASADAEDIQFREPAPA